MPRAMIFPTVLLAAALQLAAPAHAQLDPAAAIGKRFYPYAVTFLCPIPTIACDGSQKIDREQAFTVLGIVQVPLVPGGRRWPSDPVFAFVRSDDGRAGYTRADLPFWLDAAEVERQRAAQERKRQEIIAELERHQAENRAEFDRRRQEHEAVVRHERQCDAGQPRIGMTRGEAQQAWCAPQNVHTTETAAGIREQWVYSWGYLYFDNGRLVAIQRD